MSTYPKEQGSNGSHSQKPPENPEVTLSTPDLSTYYPPKTGFSASYMQFGEELPKNQDTPITSFPPNVVLTVNHPTHDKPLHSLITLYGLVDIQNATPYAHFTGDQLVWLSENGLQCAPPTGTDNESTALFRFGIKQEGLGHIHPLTPIQVNRAIIRNAHGLQHYPIFGGTISEPERLYDNLPFSQASGPLVIPCTPITQGIIAVTQAPYELSKMSSAENQPFPTWFQWQGRSIRFVTNNNQATDLEPFQTLVYQTTPEETMIAHPEPTYGNQHPDSDHIAITNIGNQTLLVHGSSHRLQSEGFNSISNHLKAPDQLRFGIMCTQA